jgi:hypothetical protein
MFAPHFWHFIFVIFYTLFPQFGQNFEFAGISALQLGHFLLPKATPQFGQNFESADKDALQFGHSIFSCLAPQLGQNFASVGIIAPHFTHALPGCWGCDACAMLPIIA